MLMHTSQLGTMANQAVGWYLKVKLHCGQTKMRLQVMGTTAADLQLNTGGAHPVPLIYLPEMCGYRMQQNALGFVLVVPYDGCNVIQENGNHVLSVSWLMTPVKFVCSVLPSPDAPPALIIPKPAQQPWSHPFIYQPSHPYWFLYYYYMYLLDSAHDSATATTTAKPKTTTITTTEKPSEPKPPMYPNYWYYPYSSNYMPPNFPPKTTVPPATTREITTTAKNLHPSKPYFPPYFPYPYYSPAGVPDNSEEYTYPGFPHFYGSHLVPQNPSEPMQTATQPPTFITPKPDDEARTTKRSDSSPTTKPVTSASTSKKRKPCYTTTRSSRKYPEPVNGYIPYHQLPFSPYFSYKDSQHPSDPK
ncbi:adhesive plaque matrix protein-like [Mastacembelus armatus]|uniref:adhesive plaque matrix protein-like n=1 Tax=Mastacembelus armatus TaxID=205130 RepID=UPI000E45AB81|nr:adhesive plaque matrix protein-like [Mastacembelus armatus]